MVHFDSVRHVYTNTFTGEEYISVTTLINKYKKAFDAQTAAERVAKREGSTPEEVKAKWKKLNTESKEYGTKIHNVIEQYNTNETIVEGYEDLIESYKKLNIVEKKDNLLVEEMLYSHADKLAGTADIIRCENKGGFSIFDIKTNKKFNFFNPYNDYMLYPVEHLSAAEYNTYSLQLSFYAYMYQRMTGRTLNQLGVIYYDRETNTFCYYPSPYLKTDVLNILQHYAKS